jgi:hypothetical protein
VTKWCDTVGVANRGVGPVVFYKGFTREFLKASKNRRIEGKK